MTGDTQIDQLRRIRLSLGRVHRVEVPTAARALCTLPSVDYEDAFLVETGPVQDRTAEQWARTVLEDAPAMMRIALRRGWSTIGLQFGPNGSDRFVLGWEVRHSTPDFVLLGASSRQGLQAELLFKRQQRKLLFTTFVQHENQAARAMWASVEPVHRPIVRFILEQASRRDRRRRQL
jgi:hypothetical protein